MALAGMLLNRGSIKSVAVKRSPVTTEVSPVLPPSSMPAALSTKLVVVESPITEPSTVAAASTSSVFCTDTVSPSLKMPAR